MVPDQPRENAHKTETNWEIIVLVNWSKSSITHNVLNLFHLTQHKLSHPKYWWPRRHKLQCKCKQKENYTSVNAKNIRLEPAITPKSTDWYLNTQTNTRQQQNLSKYLLYYDCQTQLRNTNIFPISQIFKGIVWHLDILTSCSHSDGELDEKINSALASVHKAEASVQRLETVCPKETKSDH